MARTKISEFSATAADNTDIDNIDIAEGCAPSGINNAIRELMAQLKDFQTGAAGDSFNGSFNGTNVTYSGTLTGGTGVINIGSGQVYKDASGNVGVGTSSPNTKLQVAGVVRCEATGGEGGQIEFLNVANNAVAGLVDVDGSNNTRLLALTNNALTFGTNSTERARIDTSGNLLVGTTSALSSSKVTSEGANCFAARLTTANGGAYNANYTGAGGGTAYYGYWSYSGGVVGSISSNGSTTAYNTTSDYRLKENVAPMTGALEKVAQLKPCTYTWKADGSAGQGFIAHELQAVVPDAVTGEKDAVDENGKPKYQGVDTSFLVATLTAAIQELKAEFDAYKAAHP